ncbi:MAG: hypothetical protein AB1744_00960, partial [Candidatus Zixiibacteriota bacterium]
ERSRDQVRYLIVAAELVSAGRTGWDKPTPYERQSIRLLRQPQAGRPQLYCGYFHDGTQQSCGVPGATRRDVGNEIITSGTASGA